MTPRPLTLAVFTAAALGCAGDADAPPKPAATMRPSTASPAANTLFTLISSSTCAYALLIAGRARSDVRRALGLRQADDQRTHELRRLRHRRLLEPGDREACRLDRGERRPVAVAVD